ncbi:MAG TPA: hypothetical protein VFE62_30230 [Gemmataceae bacterium]|nr:hypothetical protein [Gemmataceae bacterium]
MTLTNRFVLICVILGAGVAAQTGLNWHIHGGSGLQYAELREPISALPMSLPSLSEKVSERQSMHWIGKTNAHEEQIRKQLPFEPDDLVSRTYRRGVDLNLYMVYSRLGDDRKHHPEVCIRDVTGAPEDLEARKILFIGGDEKHPVQRFRFRTSFSHYTTVYYWHFTFPRIPRAGESILQVLHQRGSQPAPSITVQISTLAELDQLEAIETDFLVSLDRSLWKSHLPEGTVMGCDRMPITLLRR